MKRYLLFIITGATLLWSTSGHAAGAPGSLGYLDGANDNPHNLSSQSGNAKKADTETQICIFCHTPHGATADTPLWGRPEPTGPMGGFLTLTNPSLGISDPTVVAFSLYGNNTDPNEYPNGASKLCLSCHDGVTAMGILSNGDEIVMTGGAAIAIDLAGSHPISFVYDTNVLPLLTGLGKSLKLPTADYLDGFDRVQCTSCHQPHQDTMATNLLPFWRVNTNNYSNDYNTVCNACHTAPPSLGTGHGYP